MYESTIARIILAEATSQEIFDCVWDHFVTKKSPRSITNGNWSHCAYRGDKGARCAAGLLIPDEKYQESMELITFLNLAETRLPQYLKYAGIINSLQRCHDNASAFCAETEELFTPNITARLTQTAKDYFLTVKGE
jgi:hypothetical protein